MKTCSKCKIQQDLLNFHKKMSWCKSCQKIAFKTFYHKNKDYNLKRTKKWKQENPQKHAALNKKHIEKFPEKHNARCKNYEFTRKKSMPSWLNSEQVKDIKNFYKEAKIKSKQTGIQHDVDHIIPLQGKNVCGLHVPWNLQILTHVENCKKGTKLYE